MPPRTTIKDLQAEVVALKTRVDHAEANRILAETDLAEAKAKIQQQEAALAEALARGQGTGSANADGDETSQIEKPRASTRGGRIAIQESMGLDGQDELYGNIQKYIHILVPTCGIDWKQDFRVQSADNLSKLYRAARKEYPLLKRFKNDWATAELLKMYLQNSREHARTRGYLPRAGRKAASGSANPRHQNNENIAPQGGVASGGSRRRHGRGRAR
ncbi:hypothetical protein LXA43DRAFT_1101527 [Ganoderma leucocontextum]|nr:hypothetical protein LXA43DRAFT_1101527 [Ganoderma leucocontextum]